MNEPTQRNSGNASRGDSPKSSPEKQDAVKCVDTDVSELVLSARCEIAMARVEGPLNFQSAFEHARVARIWAYRAGAASLNGSRLPIAFADSPTLIGAWRAGQGARAMQPARLSLVVG